MLCRSKRIKYRQANTQPSVTTRPTKNSNTLNITQLFAMLGQAIAQGLIRFARTAGYQSIRLSSNKMLAVSHRLYERLGFRATSPWEPDGETHSLYYRLEI